MRKRALAVGFAGALFAALLPVSPAAAADCWRHSSAERQFLSEINASRRNAGRAPLALDIHLSKVSKTHTKEMVRSNSLHHTADPTLAKRVTNWSVLGENVGVGQSVDGLHKAFMDSTSHRENILYSKFKYAGVGVVKGSDGRMWVTVTFEATTNPGTTLRMPKC